MNFNLVISFFTAAVFAACPADVLVSQAKLLVGNILNSVNQRNIALILAASSSDATVSGALRGPEGQCQTFNNTPAGAFYTNSMVRGLKIVQANITDAFQTAVGYTVVQCQCVDVNGVEYKNQFNFMDPTGNCELELIIQTCLEGGCTA